MSSMLEQAIVDAKTLREAAIKNAESAVIEKYSNEVRTAVTQLLEQEDDSLLGFEEPALEMDTAPVAEEADPETQEVVDQAPHAHLTEDEVVVIDLNDIGKTLEKEVAAGEVTDTEVVTRDEIMDNLDLDITDDEAPANRPDEEVEINEEELANLFQEMLKVDVDPKAVEAANEELTKDQVEIDEEENPEAVEFTDGMDKEDIEESVNPLTAENEKLKEQNNKLKETLTLAKTTLEEINLQNARLLYSNRVLRDPSLNEQQKDRIAEMVDKARTVEEAKLIFETLQKTVANTKSSAPKSLSETISRPSSVILSGNRKETRTTSEDPTKNRWATLAGLNQH